MPRRNKNKPVVSNLVTDYIDYMIRENLDGVYFMSGKPVMFRRKFEEFPTPQFSEKLEAQDILDALEAMDVAMANIMVQTFTHRSDFFPDMRLNVNISMGSFSLRGKPTYVHICFPPNEKVVVE